MAVLTGEGVLFHCLNQDLQDFADSQDGCGRELQWSVVSGQWIEEAHFHFGVHISPAPVRHSWNHYWLGAGTLLDRRIAAKKALRSPGML